MLPSFTSVLFPSVSFFSRHLLLLSSSLQLIVAHHNHHHRITDFFDIFTIELGGRLSGCVCVSACLSVCSTHQFFVFCLFLFRCLCGRPQVNQMIWHITHIMQVVLLIAGSSRSSCRLSVLRFSIFF